jgi:hypothetical protein
MIRECPHCGAIFPWLELAGVCLRCGSTHYVQGHHMLCCGVDGAYVQPEILVPLCQPDCHQAGVHHLLRLAGIGDPMEATPGVRVERIGVNLGWLVWDRPATVTLPGALLADVADELGRIGRELRRSEASLP